MKSFGAMLNSKTSVIKSMDISNVGRAEMLNDQTLVMNDLDGFSVTIKSDSTSKTLIQIEEWLKLAEENLGSQYAVELSVTSVTTWGEYKKKYRRLFGDRQPECHLSQIVQSPQ
jgi:hypothetical protein